MSAGVPGFFCFEVATPAPPAGCKPLIIIGKAAAREAVTSMLAQGYDEVVLHVRIRTRTGELTQPLVRLCLRNDGHAEIAWAALDLLEQGDW